jgi:hypothetical protein
VLAVCRYDPKRTLQISLTQQIEGTTATESSGRSEQYGELRPRVDVLERPEQVGKSGKHPSLLDLEGRVNMFPVRLWEGQQSAAGTARLDGLR